MNKHNLAGSVVLGIAVGAILFNAGPAYADLPVIDLGAITQETISVGKETGILNVLNTINTIETDMSNAMKTLLSATGPIASMLGSGKYGTVQDLLREGFTQDANYSKAQIGAQQQIADASNTAMARFFRDKRNAQIRDEQTPSPSACASLDGGVSTESAAVQAFHVGMVMARIHDERGEALPNMPSYYGAAQGVASSGQEHVKYYCDANDQAAGLCPGGVSATPDADQESMSLFGGGTYADQAALGAAKDYAINLIEPIAPAALRGDQLSSAMGQDAAMRRRSYNARMSLAQSFLDSTIALQTQSVPPTALQTQFLQNIGQTVPQHISMLEALQIEAERRISDITWNATLQSMPPASVEREVAGELALTNYLLFQTYKLGLTHTAISATHLAEDTDRAFVPTVQMPSPALAAR